MRYYFYKRLAKCHPLPAFFCEYVFYATQALLERPTYVLASYPKCGRTWLHYMLMTYYGRKYGHPEATRLISMSRRNRRIPSVMLTHDGKICLPWSRHKWPYSGRYIVFMSRDPRDAVVSHYHHCRHRDGVYQGEITDFIRDKYYGASAIIDFMNAWWDAREHLTASHFCRYEDLLTDTRSEVTAVLSFLAEDTVDQCALEQALDAGSFENMRRYENDATTRISGLTQCGSSDNSRKVRKGEPGCYRAELIQRDVEYLDGLVAERLNPQFGYCPAQFRSEHYYTEMASPPAGLLPDAGGGPIV